MNYVHTGKLIQIVLAILITILILLQSQGKGLSGALGDVGGFYRTRRGLEKFIFVLTIALSVLFVINSLLIVYL